MSVGEPRLLCSFAQQHTAPAWRASSVWRSSPRSLLLNGGDRGGSFDDVPSPPRALTRYAQLAGTDLDERFGVRRFSVNGETLYNVNGLVGECGYKDVTKYVTNQSKKFGVPGAA